jgi:tetratricopeptide (TPR) repeat protein
MLLLAPQGPLSFVAVAGWARQEQQRAVAVLDEAVRRCPAEARLHHERGHLHVLLGAPALAEDDFRKAVALDAGGADSTRADDRVELGRLLHAAGKYQAAIDAYRAALKERPDRAHAWRLLAQPLLALKRYQAAGVALDRYLEAFPLMPGRPPGPQQAGALAEALKVRGLVHDEVAFAYRARGTLHLQKRNMREALDCYTQGLRFARDPEMLTLRGWIYLFTNAPDLALADFEEALTLRPRSPDALLGRANTRIRFGLLQEALNDAEQGLRLAGNDARCQYNAARVYAQAAGLVKVTGTGRQRQGAGPAHARRAVELLRRALKQTPAEERAAFWRDYVVADPSFDAIRRDSGLKALAVSFDLTTR